VECAYAWVHAAAHALGNEDQAPARLVRRRFDRVLATMRRDAADAGSLQGALGHFCKVARSWRPGLFHCYSNADVPRTNNDRRMSSHLSPHFSIAGSMLPGDLEVELRWWRA
jgi:hypothetical protein